MKTYVVKRGYETDNGYAYDLHLDLHNGQPTTLIATIYGDTPVGEKFAISRKPFNRHGLLE